MTHSVFAQGKVAVVTGGAGGIGLACALRFAHYGMKVAIADLGAEKLELAAETIREAGAGHVIGVDCDVAERDQLAALKARVDAELGGADLVMLNAGIQPGSSMFDAENWERVLSVNLWGIIHGAQLFAPDLAAREGPGALVVTGSKQGITSPPGDPAYNVSKAGVKVFAELLAHELRNTAPQVSAHLLIPGWVHTNIAGRGDGAKPAGAWAPAQVADFLVEAMGRGDFYVLCPDNDVPRTLDEARMQWAIGDIVENRPPLSRWHRDWADSFADFVAGRAADK